MLEIDASDDYGLSKFDLNYSVVGAGENQVNFLREPNLKSVSGSELIYLEDLEVEPGDFVSYFLTLADNNGIEGPKEVISDIYFLQVLPTDQEFRQNSGGGGGQGGAGGQGGGDSSALVTIQKDIIAATWKLKNRQGQVSQEEFNSDAEIISGGNCDDSKGYFIEPTIVLTSNPKFRTMCEEIFGPVLTIFTYEPKDWSKTLDLIESYSSYFSGLSGGIGINLKKWNIDIGFYYFETIGIVTGLSLIYKR